jgi:hypothetical protein
MRNFEGLITTYENLKDIKINAIANIAQERKRKKALEF